MQRILIIAIALFPSLHVLGQNFGGGVHIGLISSQILEMGYSTTYDKVGLFAGGFTDYRFTPNSTLQLELNFIQKGTRQAPRLTNNNFGWGINLNYIEIPVLYRWWGIRNMSVEIGPQVGVLLGHREWDQNGTLDGPHENYKAFNRADVSLAGGLSYFLLRNKLEINARYAISMVPVRERKSVGAVSVWPAALQYNSVLAFSVRWWFKNTYEAPPKAEKSLRTLE